MGGSATFANCGLLMLAVLVFTAGHALTLWQVVALYLKAKGAIERTATALTDCGMLGNSKLTNDLSQNGNGY